MYCAKSYDMSYTDSYKEFIDHARNVMIKKGVEITGDLSIRSFVIGEMGIKFIPRLINLTMDECVQVCTLYEDGYTTCKRGLSNDDKIKLMCAHLQSGFDFKLIDLDLLPATVFTPKMFNHFCSNYPSIATFDKFGYTKTTCEYAIDKSVFEIRRIIDNKEQLTEELFNHCINYFIDCGYWIGLLPSRCLNKPHYNKAFDKYISKDPQSWDDASLALLANHVDETRLYIIINKLPWVLSHVDKYRELFKDIYTKTVDDYEKEYILLNRLVTEDISLTVISKSYKAFEYKQIKNQEEEDRDYD